MTIPRTQVAPKRTRRSPADAEELHAQRTGPKPCLG